ncbi:unnamed protein product [Linum tenue]|uniref:Protein DETOXIFICATION n=1 Tax=Linum tenue TaxID=586396 RepID=A0AAV0MYU7_9ROSI|nr:unnamed protein product [Linum tenue]
MDQSPLLEKLQQLPPPHDDYKVAETTTNPSSRLTGRRKKMDVLLDQLKKVTRMAAPMVVVSVTQYLVQVVSLMMSGHLGELSLSGVAIATSCTNVTGFALLFGLAGALETLCGQAYGAEQYWKCGTYTYASIISLVPICVPVSILWYYVDDILVSIGQDPEIASVAGQYAVCLIPALFGDAVLQPLNRYFQSQGLTLPMLLSSVAALCGHVPVCWALVYKFGLGNVGAALAIGLAYWFNAGLLVLYMRWAGSCEKTRGMCWDDLGASVTEFWRFAPDNYIASLLCAIWNWSGGQHWGVERAGGRESRESQSSDPIGGGDFDSGGGNRQHHALLLPQLLRLRFQQRQGGGAYYGVGMPVAVLMCFVFHLEGKGLWVGILTASTLQAVLLAFITAFTNWDRQAEKARERIFDGNIILPA